MRRNVWIVNQYATVPSKDSRGERHYQLARVIKRHGWDTSLLVSSTTHPSGQQMLPGRRRGKVTNEDGIRTLWVKTNAYEGSALRRVLGMALYGANLLVPGGEKGLPAPDVIIGSSPHPAAAWAAYRLAKRHGVPFILEIRDVWPETLVDLGAIGESSALAKLLKRMYIHMAKHADLVLSQLPFVKKWLQENGLEETPFAWISNGAELPASTERAQAEPPETGFTFMYLGAHGNANQIDLIMEAFDEACRARPDLNLRLRFVGDGSKKKALQQQALTLASAERISFEDRIPGGEVQERASEADCLVGGLADLPVFDYGISPNKVFTYMASGRPTIWSSSAPNNPIEDAGAGIVVPGSDKGRLAKAMVSMAETSEDERAAMGKSGRDHLEQNYSFEKLGSKLARTLDKVVAASERGE